MVARYAGASLGLLAFAVAGIAGLIVRNPVEVVLSRSILALVVFCALGLILGGVTQWVIAEHEHQREQEIRKKCAEQAADTDAGPPSSQTLSRPVEA
jgi:hypothetical protein